MIKTKKFSLSFLQILAILLFVLIVGLILFGLNIPRKITLKGYIDSTGRRHFQYVSTVYIGNISYNNPYYYVGSKNVPLDLENNKTIALVLPETNKLSTSIYDQIVTIKGTTMRGKICFPSHKGIEWAVEEYCQKMQILLVDDIFDQNNSSLLDK